MPRAAGNAPLVPTFRELPMLKRFLPVALCVPFAAALFAAPPDPALPAPKIDPVPKPLASDPSVTIDYDIVYVRAPRYVMKNGKEKPSAWPEIGHPTNIDPGYDLMLLHPNGTEEVLVPGGKGSVSDLYVSFDGQWVYYSYFHNPAAGAWSAGADIYKLHVKTRKIVRLTHQEYTPNTGVAVWSQGKVGVYNLGPCPLPGGKVAFVSSRDGVRTPQGSPRYA